MAANEARISRLQMLLADENDAATQFKYEAARAWDEIARLRTLITNKGFCADCGSRLSEPHCAPSEDPRPHAYVYADSPDDESGFCQLCGQPKSAHNEVKADVDGRA